MSDEPSPKECEEAAREALEAFRNTLDEVGITGRYLARKLKREINALVTECTVPRGMSEYVYSKSMVAHDIRVKALDMAFKLRGDYPAEKKELTGADGGAVILEVIYNSNGNGKKDSGSST